MTLKFMSSNKFKSASPKALLALISVSIIWGSGFIATEQVIRANWSTGLVMFSRFSLAALIMGLVLRKKLKFSNKGEIKAGAIAGLLLFLAFFNQTKGQAGTTVSNAALLTALNVLIVPFLAKIWLKKNLSFAVLGYCFLAFVGMLVLSYSEGKFSLNPGDYLVILCAFLFAMHITALEKFSSGTDSSRLCFYQLLFAAIFSFLTYIVNPEKQVGFSFGDGFLSVVYLAAMSTCLCYFLQTWAQQYLPASLTAVVLCLEGLFGSLFSVVLGYEVFRIQLLIGAVCIIAAAAGASIMESKQDKAQRVKLDKIV